MSQSFERNEEYNLQPERQYQNCYAAILWNEAKMRKPRRATKSQKQNWLSQTFVAHGWIVSLALNPPQSLPQNPRKLTAASPGALSRLRLPARLLAAEEQRLPRCFPDVVVLGACSPHPTGSLPAMLGFRCAV